MVAEEIDQCFKWWERGLTNALSDEIEVLPMFYVVGEGIDQCFKWWERGLTNVLTGGEEIDQCFKWWRGD